MKLILPEKGGGGDLNRKILMGRPDTLKNSKICTPPDPTPKGSTVFSFELLVVHFPEIAQASSSWVRRAC